MACFEFGLLQIRFLGIFLYNGHCRHSFLTLVLEVLEFPGFLQLCNHVVKCLSGVMGIGERERKGEGLSIYKEVLWKLTSL